MTTKPVPSAAFAALRAHTPARLEVGRAGPRLGTTAALALAADRARACDASATALPAAFAKRRGLVEITAGAARPHGRGALRMLGRDALARLRRCRRRPDVQIVLADGPAPIALAAAPALAARITRRLRARPRRLGTPLLVRRGGPGVQDEIAAVLRPRILCFITSERPTPRTPESLSVHLRFQPARRGQQPVRTVVSRVHPHGLPAVEAASVVATWIDSMLSAR